MLELPQWKTNIEYILPSVCTGLGRKAEDVGCAGDFQDCSLPCNHRCFQGLWTGAHGTAIPQASRWGVRWSHHVLVVVLGQPRPSGQAPSPTHGRQSSTGPVTGAGSGWFRVPGYARRPWFSQARPTSHLALRHDWLKLPVHRASGLCLLAVTRLRPTCPGQVICESDDLEKEMLGE